MCTVAYKDCVIDILFLFALNPEIYEIILRFNLFQDKQVVFIFE